MKLYKLVFLAGVCLSLSQCRNRDVGISESTAIRSDIVIGIGEELEEGTRKFYLSGGTKTIYPCGNYGIETELISEKTGFKINYKKVIAPTICLTSLGGAGSRMELGALSNGNYDLELNIPNWKNKGILRVTKTEFQLIFKNQKGIEIPKPIIKRVPDKTYWGTIGYHQASSLAKVDSLVAKMKHTGAIFQKQDPGDYRYYQIDSKGNMIDWEPSGYYFVKSVIFQLNGSDAGLRNLIRTDGVIEKDNMSINIYNDKGERIDNWSE